MLREIPGDVAGGVDDADDVMKAWLGGDAAASHSLPGRAVMMGVEHSASLSMCLVPPPTSCMYSSSSNVSATAMSLARLTDLHAPQKLVALKRQEESDAG